MRPIIPGTQSKYKDDPDLEAMLEDAMRRRGRKPGPDGKYGGSRPAGGD
ncbi:MAG: hypothetical protein ACRC33_31405 [Gemmataceae bacterium]